jgi:hypothetical protein
MKPSRVADGGRHPVSTTTRSFARACGRRGLGDLERLRGPLPVLESAGERRRMLERTVDQGSGDAPCPWSAVARSRPRCAGCRARIGGGRSPRGRRLHVRRGSGLAAASVGRDSCRCRLASSGPGARLGKHRVVRVDLAGDGAPPRGGGPVRVKGRREPNRTGVAPGTGSGWPSASSVAGSEAKASRPTPT